MAVRRPRKQGALVDHTTRMEKLTESLLKGVTIRVFVFFVILAVPLWAGELEHPQQLYQRTEYEAALRALGAEG
jgi:hypothetical protein